MTWLLFAFGWVKNALGAVFSAVVRYPLHAALIVALVACGWLWRGKQSALAERDQARTESKANFDAHVTTIRNYRKAQDEAKGLEEKRLARVQTEQQGVNTDASESYARRLADLRARYERLRGQGATAAVSAPGGQPVPRLSDAAGRTDDAPSGGTPRDLICASQAIQLDELITWIERQHRIDPNAGTD